jgi:hypothetical protein
LLLLLWLLRPQHLLPNTHLLRPRHWRCLCLLCCCCRSSCRIHGSRSKQPACGWQLKAKRRCGYLRTASVQQAKSGPWSWASPWKRQTQRQARRPQHLLLVLLLLLQERLCKHSRCIHTPRESTWLQGRQPSSSIAEAA